MARYTYKTCVASLLLCLAFFCGCNDMRDIAHQQGWIEGFEANKILVLNEGLFNMNNSTLALYEPKEQRMDLNIFKTANKRGLGDTANDMKLWGDRIFIVVNVSSRIEIIDTTSYVAAGSIELFNEAGVARQPRYIVFDKEKAYVSCFDGNVVRIDIPTLSVDGIVRVGRNPDQLCIANGKIYVSNSGGLDFPNYDTTVSVVDLATFREVKKIEVGKNPGSIASDSEGDVYVITRGDYGDEEYRLHKIDSEIDEVLTTFKSVSPLTLTIADDIAYMYSVDFQSGENWIKRFDCKAEKVVDEHFITDGTKIETPYCIYVDPHSGDVYVTDAKSYVLWGDVLCFDRQGRLKFKIEEIGLNPNSLIIF